jgi:integrase
MKLTEKSIAALACESGQKDRLVFDDVVQGLGLRVSGAGRKGFLVQYRTKAGAKRRLPLGAWGAITLEQARQAARNVLGQVALGADPFAEKKTQQEAATSQAAAERLTLAALMADWVEIGLAQRRQGYRHEAVRALSLAFRPYLNRRADGLKRSEIIQILDALVKVGKVATSARTAAYGHACFAWAEKRGRVPSNPFANLPLKASNKARDRVLSDDEIGKIYRAAQKMEFPFGPFVWALMLTAQRRDEVAGMRWSELSPDSLTWTIPAGRSKNGKAHVVHLSPTAQELIAHIHRHGTSDLVFTTNGRTPISGYSRAKEKLLQIMAEDGDENTGMPDWRFHDLRRTCVTWLAGAGFNPAVADKILNHSTATGITTVGQVYQRAEYLPERKLALEAWARHVLNCAAPKNETANILPFQASKT